MKKLIFSIATLLIASIASAQIATITNVKAKSLQNVSAITENDEVKGYVAFYFVDKENKKESNYKLNVYDNNLSLKYDIDLVKPAAIRFVDAAYNGNAFCFSFYDPKAKKMEYLVYDKEGKKKGSYFSEPLSKIEMAYLQQELADDGTDSPFSGILIGIPGSGFIRYGLDGDKGRQTIIDFISNEGKKGWSKTIKGEDDNDYTVAIPLAYGKDVLATLVYVRESMMAQKFKKTIIKFQSTADGKDLFKFDCVQKKHQYAPSGVSIEGDNIIIFGEYYKPTDNSVKDNSTGMFIIEFDQAGKIVKESYQGWKENINKTIPSSGKQKMDEKMKIALHDIVKTADGNYFAIGEQYMRVADGVGIAMKVLNQGGGSSAVTKISSFNMMVMQFNSDFVIQSTEIFEKNKTSISLMSGMDYFGTAFIAYYLKSTGQFDYCFTTASADKKTFNVAYVNYDRKTEGGINVIGNISYTKDQKLVQDKIELKTKPTSFIALPGKPGYVAVMEFFRKEKKATIRIEKLNI